MEENEILALSNPIPRSRALLIWLLHNGHTCSYHYVGGLIFNVSFEGDNGYQTHNSWSFTSNLQGRSCCVLMFHTPLSLKSNKPLRSYPGAWYVHPPYNHTPMFKCFLYAISIVLVEGYIYISYNPLHSSHEKGTVKCSSQR